MGEIIVAYNPNVLVPATPFIEHSSNDIIRAFIQGSPLFLILSLINTNATGG